MERNKLEFKASKHSHRLLFIRLGDIYTSEGEEYLERLLEFNRQLGVLRWLEEKVGNPTIAAEIIVLSDITKKVSGLTCTHDQLVEIFNHFLTTGRLSKNFVFRTPA